MSDALEIPADLIALQPAWIEADQLVQDKLAEMERHDAEHGWPPLPVAPDDPALGDGVQAKLRQARTEAAAAVRAGVTALAGDSSQYWTFRDALLKAAAN